MTKNFNYYKNGIVIGIIILFFGISIIPSMGLTLGENYIKSNKSFNGQTIYGTIEHDGLQREYILYVPDSYTGEKPVSLVLNFHGYTSSAESQMNYGDFRLFSDADGFLVVHPQGTEDNYGNAYWNVGGFWHPGGDADDVGFTEALIDSLASDYKISMTRVYATGMSNGGYFSFHLAGQLSNRIAAVAPVAGTMTPNSFENCYPQHPMPVLQTHGTADFVVPYGGTAWSLSIEAVLDYWIDYNNCNTEPIITELPDIDPTDGSTVTHFVYSEGDNDVNVEHFRVNGGGHDWPGSIYGGNQDINVCEENWLFFSRYSLGTVHVDDDAEPGWYDATHVKTIQEGIDNASAGDTVFVNNGNYYENVDVYQSINLIGEDKLNTIVDGSDGDFVFKITDNLVNISGFTIKNGLNGFLFDDSTNCAIIGVLITDNINGMYLGNSCGNAIYHNNFINNEENANDQGENTWDNGYPSGGNYWYDYEGVDNFNGPDQDIPGSDDIGDTSYPISGGDNIDRYPLMIPWINVPPTSPEINGETNGKPGEEYCWNISSIDPDGDDIMYIIDWDDGETTETDCYLSGEDVEVCHTYSEPGTYTIRAKAKECPDGLESDWTELQVTMPRNILLPNTFLLRLFERFPNRFPIIRQILGQNY